MLYLICAQSALTLIITMKGQESHQHLILSQLRRNNETTLLRFHSKRELTIKSENKIGVSNFNPQDDFENSSLQVNHYFRKSPTQKKRRF